jgi:RNA polymerase sigma-70 factor (ECF subfamily)
MGTERQVENTVELTNRAREGDQAALEELCERCLDSLTRYAAGKVPSKVRDMLDTQDVVSEAVQRGMSRLNDFEVRHPGALVAYMRAILRHLIIDYVRRRTRQPLKVSLDEQQPDHGSSPLDQAVGAERLALYRAARARLKPRDAELVTLKIEDQHSYDEIAVRLGFPSNNAARVATRRAVLRLARELSWASGAGARAPGVGTAAPPPHQPVRHYPDESILPRGSDRGHRIRIAGRT